MCIVFSTQILRNTEKLKIQETAADWQKLHAVLCGREPHTVIIEITPDLTRDTLIDTFLRGAVNTLDRSRFETLFNDAMKQDVERCLGWLQRSPFARIGIELVPQSTGALVPH